MLWLNMFICQYIDFWWASSKIEQHYVGLHPVAEEQKEKKGKGCCFYILGRTAVGGVVWGWGTFEYPWRSELGKNLWNTSHGLFWHWCHPFSSQNKQVREVEISRLTGKILNFTDVPRNETWQITSNNSPMPYCPTGRATLADAFRIFCITLARTHFLKGALLSAQDMSAKAFAIFQDEPSCFFWGVCIELGKGSPGYR